MKMLWKILSWISVLCGLTTFLIAWVALLFGGSFFGIAPEFYFFDAIAAVQTGIFFLIWGKVTEGGKK
mgnify:CR=1 FL=1